MDEFINRLLDRKTSEAEKTDKEHFRKCYLTILFNIYYFILKYNFQMNEKEKFHYIYKSDK